MASGGARQGSRVRTVHRPQGLAAALGSVGRAGARYRRSGRRGGGAARALYHDVGEDPRLAVTTSSPAGVSAGISSRFWKGSIASAFNAAIPIAAMSIVER